MRRLLLFALLTACGDRSESGPPPADTTAVAVEPEEPVEIPGTYDAAFAARGRAVVADVCSECHATEPPPVTAPTLREISDRYHEVFLDPQEAIAHLADYIRQPSPSASQLPQVMLDEWGVMPPQAIAPADRDAVAFYIWYLSEGGS